LRGRNQVTTPTRLHAGSLEGGLAMRRHRTIGLLAILGALLALALGPSTAAAAAPERETITISFTFHDDL